MLLDKKEDLMRKILISLFLLSTGCAVYMAPPAAPYYHHFPKPKLELYALNIDHASGKVDFEAHLLGSRRALLDPRYHCLQEYWTFGDGRALIQESPCDRSGNANDGANKVEFFFYETNLYWAQGKYTARLQLIDRDGRTIVKSNKVKLKFKY